MDWQSIIQAIMQRFNPPSDYLQQSQNLPGTSTAYPRRGYMTPADASMSPGALGMQQASPQGVPFTGAMPSGRAVGHIGSVPPGVPGMSNTYGPFGTSQTGPMQDPTIMQGFLNRYLGR